MTMVLHAPGGELTGSDLRRVAAGLARGEVVAYPTETFYGVGCPPRQAAAVARLLALKGRPDGKPLPLIAEGARAAAAAVRLESALEQDLWRRLAAGFWPGPLTLVAPAAPGLAPGVTAGGTTVALRVSGLPLARRLAGAGGGLIIATSANPRGAPPPVTAAEAAAGLGPGLDLLVDGGAAPGGAPSTLVEVTGGSGQVLREGAISAEVIRRAMEREPD